MVKKYTDKQLLDRVKEIGSFIKIPQGRWILGVRSSDDLPNRFDDKFYEYHGEEFIQVLTGTTNPGITILKGGFKRFNKVGSAILKADQWYYNVWKYGLHRGKMPALRQIGNAVLVHRDGDMDGKSEELGKPKRGYFGINYHSNTYNFRGKNLNVTREFIGDWSAGCQVINQRKAYLEQMKWYENALKNGEQKWVSYCLLNEF